ncbi:hypothetical protein HOH87_01250 [bacterium]|jgi:hypothetical protein|nr:hypothetical protein [bacterium]
MTDSLRRHLAYIVARLLVQNPPFISLYDYKSKKSYAFDGKIQGNELAILDFEAKQFIIGKRQDNTLSMVHQGTNKKLSLQMQGAEFYGLDEASNAKYSGLMKDHAVSIYDFEKKAHFHYAIQPTPVEKPKVG